MLNHREKREGWSGGRSSRRKAWAGAFIVISMGKDKAQQEGFRLASVSHFSRLCSVEAISSYLVLDLKVMGAEENCLLQWERQTEEVAQSTGIWTG